MSTLFTDFFVKINQISPLGHDFTEVLSTIALTPKTLYFRGKLPKNVSKNGRNVRPKTVAIVGSRHNTKYGEEVAYNLAYELAKHEVVVISGLAYGIDSIAHRGCLDAGGTTVAILGTPVDEVYPKAHDSIAHSIIERNGAILSEYSPRAAEYVDAPLAPGEAGLIGDKWISYKAEDNNSLIRRPFIKRRIDPKRSFLFRNRLISGLSDAVVVVEAAEKSGTLNTASHALSQGKDVFAVPGNITSPYSKGCNKLIRDGAIPYTAPEDVLWSLLPEEYINTKKHLRRNNLIGDNDVESLILQAIASGHSSSNEIMAFTKLPPEVFCASVTLLEVRGRISSLGKNNWNLLS